MPPHWACHFGLSALGPSLTAASPAHAAALPLFLYTQSTVQSSPFLDPLSLATGPTRCQVFLTMSTSSSTWFSPAPSEVSSSRISLDFGLRAADQFFRELVVPEIGRIWFARQLSWPLAALALHEELASHRSNAPKPTAICHGIEALACKLEYTADNEKSQRILGRRAFGRDAEQEVWSFHRLRQATNYVRNTHRQAATRALRVDGGLGFASGSRFDLLEMEPVGRALANALLKQPVGKGGMSLQKWLLGWLDGDREISDRPRTLLQALSPEHATDEERKLVSSRLLGTSTPASEKRQRLAIAVGRAAAVPDIEMMAGLSDARPIAMMLYRPLEAAAVAWAAGRVLSRGGRRGHLIILMINRIIPVHSPGRGRIVIYKSQTQTVAMRS